MPAIRMLNIGCGNTYHPDWINLDVAPATPDVMAVNINEGLPFPADYADVCYSSHMLEHLDRPAAKSFVAECFRVLKSGGTIRLVLPDLEALARDYLRILEATASGDESRAPDYEWIMLELFDQVARNESGGEMYRFLVNLDKQHRSFVRSRIGSEAEKIWEGTIDRGSRSFPDVLSKKIFRSGVIRSLRIMLAGWFVYLIAGKAAHKSFRQGIFRSSGEIHQWMYDRYSLKKLLELAGFAEVKVCTAQTSRISDFDKYALDFSDGTIRKPDSIFIEASKP